jgi:hypothetical protein
MFEKGVIFAKVFAKNEIEKMQKWKCSADFCTTVCERT